MKPEVMWHGTVAFSLIAAGAAIIVGTAYLLYGPNPSKMTNATSTAATTTVSKPISLPTFPEGFRFDCDAGKAIEAAFSKSSVQLALSDGRSMILPQTISGSGARYANPDESFVFWNKGNTAFITENGTNTYDGCVTQQQTQ